MDGLNINYNETRAVGTQVSQKAAEFKELLTKIRGLNSELQTYWQGQDASKYSSAVNEQAEFMLKLANTTDEIGQFLIKIGNAYEEAMINNANAIK